MPGLSISRAPPGIRKSSRRVVVCRPRSSLCRTSRVACTFSSRRRLMSVDFPTPEGAHEHRGLTRPKQRPHFVEAEPVKPIEAARHQHPGPQRNLLDLGLPCVDRFRKIGFVEQHRGRGATLPDGGQVALEPSRVEISVEPHDDDDDVGHSRRRPARLSADPRPSATAVYVAGARPRFWSRESRPSRRPLASLWPKPPRGASARKHSPGARRLP